MNVYIFTQNNCGGELIADFCSKCVCAYNYGSESQKYKSI